MFTVGTNQTRGVRIGVLAATRRGLGIAPGQWPNFVTVVNEQQIGWVFIKTRPLATGGWRYESRAQKMALEISDN